MRILAFGRVAVVVHWAVRFVTRALAFVLGKAFVLVDMLAFGDVLALVTVPRFVGVLIFGGAFAFVGVVAFVRVFIFACPLVFAALARRTGRRRGHDFVRRLRAFVLSNFRLIE
ncbi:MAG TPA: hypothetical protein VF778_10710 [Xanthobacteraceae bacterium]